MKKTLLSIVLLCYFCSAVVAQNIIGEYRLWIEVDGNGGGSICELWFDDESTWGDPNFPPTYGYESCCDAVSLLTGTGNAPGVYTEVVAPPLPPNSPWLASNGLPLLFEPTAVPLGFYVGTANAQFTFTFSQLASFPLGTTVELEDLSLGVIQDLMLDSSYVTWGAPSDAQERFIIHINRLVTGIEIDKRQSVSVKTSVSETSIAIHATQPTLTGTRLIDINGRVLVNSQFAPSSDRQIPVDNLAKGVYMLTTFTKSGKVFQNKLIL